MAANSHKKESMNFKTIQYKEQAGVATITLNRPDKRNAISPELVEDLLDALATAEHSRGAKVVILTGEGKAFCAGMDLEALRETTTSSKEKNRKDSETMARLFRSIYEFPKPTIAAVNGAAIAGGCGIATLCDFTLASSEARFGYTEVRIGFLPAIVSVFLIRQVGENVARDLLMTGRIVDANQAVKLGLAQEVLAPDRVLPRAEELARELMENSPASMVATKKLLTAFALRDLDALMELAIAENARIRTTPDFREGVTAFLEKREPRWVEEVKAAEEELIEEEKEKKELEKEQEKQRKAQEKHAKESEKKKA